MLGACKKHPQAYLLYVEDCFLQSDNAFASYADHCSLSRCNQYICR